MRAVYPDQLDYAGKTVVVKRNCRKTTPVGFEPTRAKPNGLAGRRLNHSAKVSNAGRPNRTAYRHTLPLTTCLETTLRSYTASTDRMAQRQRVGFQTRRLGVRIPLRSRCLGQWSRGMILALGARGRGFESPLAPTTFFRLTRQHYSA